MKICDQHSVNSDRGRVDLSPSRRFDLGLETGLAVANLPYSSNDGEPVLGKLGVDGPLRVSVTLLPRMLGARLRLPAGTFIGVLAGATHIVGALGEFSVVPYPTGSVGVEEHFGEEERFGVRAAFSYMHFWFGDAKAFMTSTLAFTWNIWARAIRPSTRRPRPATP